jgi:D-arabinose 1-dehydrogenase-like Zn-dependent alcohol dehydrogenase
MSEVLWLAGAGKIKPVIDEFKLEDANDVLRMLKQGEVRARAVLLPQ